MKRPVALVAALLLLALLGPAVALAQDTTPVAGTFPVTPDPAECQVEPRSAEEFLAISAGATPTAAAPVASAVEVPLGEAADAETVAAVTTTVREILACFNAGDFPRAFSLFSTDAIRQTAAEDPLPEEELRAFLEATPEALPAGERTTLLALTDVMDLEDGQVGAFLATTDAFTGPDTVYVVFVQEDDRWLIDDIVEFLVPGGGEEGEGTPAA